MYSVALSQLIKEAKHKNKAVELKFFNDLRCECYIEPEMSIMFPNETSLKVEGVLINLKCIAFAIMVPNRLERKNEFDKLGELE